MGWKAIKRGIDKARKPQRNMIYTTILPVFLYEHEAVHFGGQCRHEKGHRQGYQGDHLSFHHCQTQSKEGDQTDKDKAFYEKNEYNKWVDDSYMLMGKAICTRESFSWQWKPLSMCWSPFPMEDIRFLAMTWLARAYIMIEETGRQKGFSPPSPMRMLFRKNTWWILFHTGQLEI